MGAWVALNIFLAMAYSITLLNCFPGDCLTIPRTSRSQSVARTSEEFKPDCSTRSSIGTGSSALSKVKSVFSEGFRDSESNRLRCSASGCSAFTSIARGRGQFFDYVVRVGHELCSLFDQLVGR